MRTIKDRWLLQVLILASSMAGATACAEAADSHGVGPTAAVRDHQTGNAMKIQIEIEDRTIAATLDDNPTARDFAALLPLTLRLRDYAATEKISDLPRRLSTAGAPEGFDPSVGDLAYYAPWGNLAVFYEDSGYASGLTKLGRIASGIEALSRPGTITASFHPV